MYKDFLNKFSDEKIVEFIAQSILTSPYEENKDAKTFGAMTATFIAYETPENLKNAFENIKTIVSKISFQKLREMVAKSIIEQKHIKEYL